MLKKPINILTKNRQQSIELYLCNVHWWRHGKRNGRASR